jgi:hypothetical protein
VDFRPHELRRRKQVSTAKLDFGTLSSSTYSNKYFGLTVMLPEGWAVQDHQAQQKMMKLGGEMIAGGDKNLQALVKASEPQTVNLFAAFAHPVGAPVAFNPSIVCVAERLDQLPGIKRGSDYLFHMRRALEAGQVKVAFPKDVWSERLGGREFDVMFIEMTVGATTIRQRYYVLVHKGYALGFVASASTSDEETQLKRVMESVTFK